MIDCLTCEEGYEIVPVHDDCTGFCVASGASVDYFKGLGFGDLATSTCTAVLDCYDDEERTAIESLPTDGTNDFLPGEGGDGSYSYSYGIVDFCTDDTGFLDCIGAALLSGEVTGDEVDAAFDAISGFEDDGWSADTCAEFQQEPNLAEQCGSWTLGQCDAEYKAWVGCIFTTTFARGGLDCPIDCDAVIGTPSRPSTMPPTENGATMPPTEQPATRPPTGNDSDGALGLTTTLAAAAVVAAAF